MSWFECHLTPFRRSGYATDADSNHNERYQPFAYSEFNGLLKILNSFSEKTLMSNRTFTIWKLFVIQRLLKSRSNSTKLKARARPTPPAHQTAQGFWDFIFQ